MDVTISHPAPHGWTEDLSHIQTVEARKRSKYDQVCEENGLRFNPFVSSTFGALGKSALDLLDEIVSVTSKGPHGFSQRLKIRREVRQRVAFAVATAVLSHPFTPRLKLMLFFSMIPTPKLILCPQFLCPLHVQPVTLHRCLTCLALLFPR